MSAILAGVIGQIVTAVVGALIGGISMHLYHTSGSGSTPAAPAQPGTGLLANHPVLQQVLHEVVKDAEDAALNVVRARLSASPAVPSVGVAVQPTAASMSASVSPAAVVK